MQRMATCSTRRWRDDDVISTPSAQRFPHRRNRSLARPRRREL